jgi:hypothetical protein
MQVAVILCAPDCNDYSNRWVQWGVTGVAVKQLKVCEC